MTAKDNFIHICNLTTTILGLPKGSLAFKTRKQEFQVPRMVAAVIGRTEENISHTIIGEVINRHRASIYHYEKSHEGNYASWEDYRDKFNLILNAYSDLKGTMPEFTNRLAMKRYVLQFVRDSSKEQVEILITSGKVGCKIKTSFFDFSHTLQNLKFALKKYNHSIAINLL